MILMRIVVVATLTRAVVDYDHSKDDYNHAIADFTKAIELNPNDARAYSGRGTAYQSKGEA